MDSPNPCIIGIPINQPVLRGMTEFWTLLAGDEG